MNFVNSFSTQLRSPSMPWKPHGKLRPTSLKVRQRLGLSNLYKWSNCRKQYQPLACSRCLKRKFKGAFSAGMDFLRPINAWMQQAIEIFSIYS